MMVVGKTRAVLEAAASLPPARARAVLAALAARESGADAETATLAEAFERDMQPVRRALAEAVQEGDIDALRGLRALLPHLLAEVMRSPELAVLLAWHVGKAVLVGMRP